MAKRGIAQIIGPKTVKLGEIAKYRVSKTYRKEDDAKVPKSQWKLYVKENGSFRELKPVQGTPPKIGRETSITITNQQLLGKVLLLEAFLYEPEKSTPPGIIIKVESGGKKIERVDLFKTDDSKIENGEVLKYGQSIIVKVTTVNMPNEKVIISLYEDDEKGTGHSQGNEKNKVDSVEKRLDEDGFVMHTFKLPVDFMKIANAYLDGSQDKFHEYYINVKSTTDEKASQNVNVPNLDYIYEGGEIEEVTINVKAKEIGVDPMSKTGTSVSIVKEQPKTENLIDAYFAKKEYTKPTDEQAGTHQYTFANANNNINKDNVAKIIKDKTDALLKAEKKYAKLDVVKSALNKTSYTKGEKISFIVYKLGVDFKRINSAPLEDKVYLVAKASMLDGKEATVTVKEKDGVINGSANAILSIMEIAEAQMEQTSPQKEVQGTEKTEFSGTFFDGLVKIPVQLRPKSDEDLKQWKEKLAKGKEDGTYTYTFAGQVSIPNGSGDEKKRIAGNILNNAKNGLRGNPKIEDGKTAFAEDIENALTKELYKQGETITFKLYKKQEELLYLNVKAQGEKQHNKDFLKQEGQYFQIGKSKYIIFPLRIKPRNDINGPNKKDYWAENGSNQTTFGYNREGGARKHAARDLETDKNETVVAIADGIVLAAQDFYEGTHEITIHHKIPDGREFIIRYGELDPKSLLVSKGDEVLQNQELGKTGKMNGISRYMVHFEQYTGAEGFNVEGNRLTVKTNPPFKRRKDLVDSLEILQEGYRNTFEEDTKESQLFTIEDGKKAITELYNKYKNNTWKWKWNGSATEVEVTGKDLLTIVEKMYRLETTHFTSKQYQNCGTGGMEVFGEAPNYGWDGSLYSESPIGTWSAFENPGLSGQGGNAQVTDRPKEFVKLPSVISGMLYKINYIIKYNGNFERWFNKTDEIARARYRTTLGGIRARFIEEIAK